MDQQIEIIFYSPKTTSSPISSPNSIHLYLAGNSNFVSKIVYLKIKYVCNNTHNLYASMSVVHWNCFLLSKFVYDIPKKEPFDANSKKKKKTFFFVDETV